VGQKSRPQPIDILYIMCRRCGAEEQTSTHVLFECEAFTTLRLAYLGSL